MDAERVRIETDAGVAVVRMARADKHNGLDWRMFTALNEAIDSLGGVDDLRAVVLTGEGPSFCAGLDIASFVEATASSRALGSSAPRERSPTAPSGSPTAGASWRCR